MVQSIKDNIEMISSENAWLSAHLYYYDRIDHFLKNAVKPFIKKVFDMELTEQFFFIRYWERGPHIRLRFKGRKEVLQGRLKDQLKSYFDSYFERYPSHSDPLKLEENTSSKQQWFPDNSIQFIDYNPELERYGGLKGIGIAEEFFQVSSQTILSLIGKSNHWNYDLVLGTAIQLHLSFAFAVGMNISEASEFYNFIHQNRFISSYTNKFKAYDLKKEQLEMTRKAFLKEYNKQKDTLISFHRALWTALENDEKFDQNWLNRWIINAKSFGQSLKHLQKRKQLVLPERFKPNLGFKTSEPDQLLWSILESQIHMTNNRLGVLNRDEAYLGYIMRQSLEHIQEIKEA